jgi:hypothetical protein
VADLATNYSFSTTLCQASDAMDSGFGVGPQFSETWELEAPCRSRHGYRISASENIAVTDHFGGICVAFESDVGLTQRPAVPEQLAEAMRPAGQASEGLQV